MNHETIKLKDLRGLDYISNSCYQDSVLLCTFAIRNPVITQMILKRDVKELRESKQKWISCGDTDQEDYINRKNIQNELIKITKSMRLRGQSVSNCSVLRKMMEMCPGTQSFHGSGMQDAGEYLQYLFNIFQVNIAHTSQTTFVTNDMGDDPEWTLVDTTYDKKASPIVSIHIDNMKKRQINEFLVQVDINEFTSDNLYRHKNVFYRKKLVLWKVIRAPYLVFYVHRLKNNIKMRTSIFPVQKIGGLSLSAIIVHSSLHYTAYFKYKGQWFYYDDNPGKKEHIIIRIGEYIDMMRSSPMPSINGTLFYYT